MSVFSNLRNIFSLDKPLHSAFNQNAFNAMASNFNYLNNIPKWVSLDTPEFFESAVRYNPIVNSAIRLLANTASNGRKYLIDTNTGDEISWDDKREVVQKIKRLLVDRPNPMQSGKEYDYQGTYYLETFGNRYVYGLMPSGFDKELDVMNVEALWNLPSQFITVKTTGKIYNQTAIDGIVSAYANTNTNPITPYAPSSIMHYNDVNISSDQASVMGISKLESLRDPIRNIEACFQAMNTLLRTGGAKGIVSVDSKDGQGSIVPLDDASKKEVNDTFKRDYGTQNGQKTFLLSPVPLNYKKIAMTAKELGIYEELASNTLYIANMLGIPNELLKTDTKGSTFENQRQSVKRLYQDTTIPKVEDRDQYTSERLNLSKYNIAIKTKWDHIPVLAEDQKEKATTDALNEKSAISGYNANLITWNQYLERTGEDIVDGGDIYKYERERLTTPSGNNVNNE